MEARPVLEGRQGLVFLYSFFNPLKIVPSFTAGLELSRHEWELVSQELGDVKGEKDGGRGVGNRSQAVPSPPLPQRHPPQTPKLLCKEVKSVISQ